MTDDQGSRPPPVAVPHQGLSAAALRGLVESFVLREGTDYGERDVSFDAKVGQVMGQLERGGACILFDPASASVNIVRVGDEPLLPDRSRPR